jgi:hypoxia up-regulated 1
VCTRCAMARQRGSRGALGRAGAWLGVGCLLLGLGMRLEPAGAAVLGIDLGSEYMKVSLIQPGSMMEIVTNVHSKRKTENIVSFYEGERSYGAGAGHAHCSGPSRRCSERACARVSDAWALQTRKPELTYARLSTLLGRRESHPAVGLLQEAYFPFQVGSRRETRVGWGKVGG